MSRHQGPSNRAPAILEAILDYLFGKLLRLGFWLEFAASRYVRTIGNVPDIVVAQVNPQTSLA
jgi:hypothetical protein